MSKRKTSTKGWETILRGIPGYDPYREADGFRFDPDAAQLRLDFFAECLKHVKGKSAGQPFHLEPWEASIVANLFGWKRKDGRRRYRECLIFVARKNGKTALAAGLVNAMLFCDNEPGAEIYGAASEHGQACMVFDHVRGQIMQDADLSARCKIFNGQAKAVTSLDGLSSYRVLSADATTKHGQNVHFAVIDELHCLPNRDLVDTIRTGTGSRRQPLIVYITTADFDREGSICNEIHDYADKVRDGVIEDPEFLPVIFEADKADDWKAPATWRKANPNLGVTVSEEYLQAECQRAQEIPEYENTFKRLHLNLRTETHTRWLSLDKWDACPDRLPDLAGQICYGGLDMATTTDIAAFVLLFPNQGNALLPFFWIPRDSIEQRERRDRVPYATWARQGFVRPTEGNVIDYDIIRRDIVELGKKYNIREICLDRWNTTQLATQLQGDGFNMVAFGQGFASMSAPTKHLEKLILGAELNHGGNPVLRWMFSNVAIETDAAANIKISKKKSTEKVDGLVAAVMAIGAALIAKPAKVSKYETQELFVA